MYDCRLHAANHDLAPGYCQFTPDVPKGHIFLFIRLPEQSCAGDLSDFLFSGDNLRTRSDRLPGLYNESRKLAMHRAARTNPLHDFLSDVASLIEVQRAYLLGFLWQIAFANIHSVQRDSSDDAMQLQRFASDWRGAVRYQGVPSLLHIVRRKPKFVLLVNGVLPTHSGALYAITVTRTLRLDNLQWLGVRNVNASGSQHLARP